MAQFAAGFWPDQHLSRLEPPLGAGVSLAFILRRFRPIGCPPARKVSARPAKSLSILSSRNSAQNSADSRPLPLFAVLFSLRFTPRRSGSVRSAKRTGDNNMLAVWLDTPFGGSRLYLL